MISTKEKNKTPKDSMDALPCFYFVEIMVGEGTRYCLQSGCGAAVGAPVGEGSIHAGGCQLNSFRRDSCGSATCSAWCYARWTESFQLATGYHAPFFRGPCKPQHTMLARRVANPYISKTIFRQRPHPRHPRPQRLYFNYVISTPQAAEEAHPGVPFAIRQASPAATRSRRK
ncbi:Phospholipid phosphatase-related protein type 3 [Camelus dromedarius]|uniref:Phospholipid phosphatase-related protein type 3 n=1 Tax=Camelus dromedarius TaxID=9838 RepID=A0A5N4CL89_CAMDR|nr:Phospholipid phosphatase-related protein type 3 [Camelus dromedarius]